MNSKHCPHCHFNTNVVKIGTTSSGRQRFMCRKCCKTWTSKSHPQVLARRIWHDLVFHNQNVEELAKKYSVCARTIRNKLDLYNPPEITPSEDDKNTTVIAMDVTYFRRTGGVLTVINVHNGNTLYQAETGDYETVWDYEKAIMSLMKYGIHPKAAVVDGKKGVIEMLESYGIYVQMCQFHQKKIVRKYIRQNPVIEENKSLKYLADDLTRTHRKLYEEMVYVWRAVNFSWLSERTYYKNDNGNRRWEYTHKESRSAINSLFRNLPYLFTFEDHPELNIPNTNNMIEGIHSELKRRLANHRGLKKEQKIKFIRIFLSGRTEV